MAIIGMIADAVHPHPRGADLLQWHSMMISKRFTPTRVGQTPLFIVDTMQSAVHPHPRGADAMLDEKRFIDAVHPHPRGADFFLHKIAGLYRRFTPTRVGQTRKKYYEN